MMPNAVPYLARRCGMLLIGLVREYVGIMQNRDEIRLTKLADCAG